METWPPRFYVSDEMSTPAKSEPSRPDQRFPWLVILCATPVLAALLWLGTWQVQRLAWKEDLLATIDARLASQPAPVAEIAQIAAAGGDIRYRPVEVSGTFDHNAEQHFFATHKGASGYFVYTPLERAEGGLVLINRGFVPFDLKERASRPESAIAGEVTVTGLARERLTEKPSFIVPDNDPAANIHYWKDWQLMVAQAGLAPVDVLPFFIDADATPNPGGLPVGGVTRIDLPNNHLQYAITWYGLALTLIVVVGAFVWRRTR